MVKKLVFELPPARQPTRYIFQPSKSGSKQCPDSKTPNKPMSQQAIQKMTARVRKIMAAKFQNKDYLDIVAHSERASLAYWLAKDPSVPLAGKLRALRMKKEATYQMYAAKGFARLDMQSVWDKFSSAGAIKTLRQHQARNGKNKLRMPKLRG